MLIGLTGKYCAGKNFVASLLEARGLAVIDVDKLGYQALESEKEAVFDLFGRDLQNPDGTLNRKLLGEKVFGNPQKLAALEQIVHPVANRLTEEWINDNAGKIKVINAALLHRSSVFNQLDKIIIVKAPFLTRFLRARKRDNLGCLAILKRFASQNRFGSQYLAKNAEIYIVKNPNKPIGGKSNKNQDLENQIGKFLEGIK